MKGVEPCPLLFSLLLSEDVLQALCCTEFPDRGGEVRGEGAMAAILIYFFFSSSKSVLGGMSGGEE